jgi:DNA-binding NarL/FixJ family response regulator
MAVHTPERIRILIADDHDIFIDALASMLGDAGEIEVITTASDGREAVELVAQHPELDLIVLDVSMPGMDGIDALREVRRSGNDVPALMLTQELTGGTITRAMKAGAAGYVLKTAGRDEFLSAIRLVAAGGEYISEDAKTALIARLTGRRSPVDQPALTRRELEILKLVATGLSTRQMADQLFISAYTVETHRRNLLQKLGLKNAAGLVRYAIDHGLVDE